MAYWFFLITGDKSLQEQKAYKSLKSIYIERESLFNYVF